FSLRYEARRFFPVLLVLLVMVVVIFSVKFVFISDIAGEYSGKVVGIKNNETLRGTKPIWEYLLEVKIDSNTVVEVNSLTYKELGYVLCVEKRVNKNSDKLFFYVVKNDGVCAAQ